MDQIHNKTADFWARFASSASVLVALVLITIKLAAWLMTGSMAVLGSLADSGLDLLASIIAFLGVRWAAEPADDEHRFGHFKAESLASFTQIMVMLASIAFIIWESVHRLISPAALVRSEIALAVMVVSLMLTLMLVGVQTYAVRRSDSLVVEGDRAHYIGDLIANVGAILAIILAAQFGLYRADALAGLLAALFLIKAVWEIIGRALPQLMDEELSKKDRKRIISIVKQDADVRGLHALRTRRAGRRRFIQFHLELAPMMPLIKAHDIADRVESRLLKVFPGADIMIHQDPHGEVEAHDSYGVVAGDE